MSGSQNWVAMGYIKGAFGVKGWVKVHAGTEYADSLLDYPEWRLTKGGNVQVAEIEAGKVAVRTRKGQDLGTFTVEEFLEILKTQVRNRDLKLLGEA